MVNNFGRTATVSPNPDEITEFRVTSSNFSAEYGYGSNVLSVTTRSGTNALHGTLWEFLRNKDLDARNFFARTAEPRKRNQFGAAAGGPVYIPGVYNGKDRTFWFFNFEGQRERLGRTIISSVPTARMRMGDLSELPARIYDPRTTRPDASSPSGFVRDPFPGNIIPGNRVDQPIAQRFLEWIPLPNQPGFANNNLFTTSEINDYEHYGFRIDHRLTEKDNLSFRGSYQPNEFPNSTGPYGPSVKPPYDLGTNPKQSTGHSYVLSWVRNITPNTLSDIRVAFARIGNEIQNKAVIPGGTDWTTAAGIQGFGPGVSDIYPSLPQLSYAGFTGLPSNGGFGLADYGNNLEYAANFTLIRGKPQHQDRLRLPHVAAEPDDVGTRRRNLLLHRGIHSEPRLPRGDRQRPCRLPVEYSI